MPLSVAETYARAPRRLSVGVLALLLSWGCGDGPRAGAGARTDLTSPAGEGSGEPFLSTSEDAVFLSWLEPAPTSGHDLWVARLDGEGWGPRTRVAHGERFFVNWADFPSVLAAPDGALWAHWLERTEGPGLAYAVRVGRSLDGGTTWSEPWTPHEDDTPTEHGFVSLFPFGDGVALTWLDGRKYAEGPAGEPATREMTVRFRATDASGAHGPEVLLDGRSCDCCQTDAALTREGPVVVYRDRTEDEIRDVYITRWTGEGWTEGVPVHEDGWHIAGCPVNGPAVAARDDAVAVAWFTAAGDTPRVYVAFSANGGRTFGAPVRVDSGNPAGRVDLLMRPDGSVLVSWLERTGGAAADIRIRHVPARGEPGAVQVVTASSAERASGFPRMVAVPWNPARVLVAWTDASDDRASGVRIAEVEVEQ